VRGRMRSSTAGVTASCAGELRRQPWVPCYRQQRASTRRKEGAVSAPTRAGQRGRRRRMTTGLLFWFSRSPYFLVSTICQSYPKRLDFWLWREYKHWNTCMFVCNIPDELKSFCITDTTPSMTDE
jgi:hypothetical protein